MKIPLKIKTAILEEANKNARFAWYSGWEKASGYIKSELRGDCRYGTTRIYIKWERKLPPNEKQIKEQVALYVERLLNNEEHHQTQRDFTHYLLETWYVDLNRLKHETMLSVIDCLPDLIAALEESNQFVAGHIQSLHNDLKNLECAVNDSEALSQFLEKGRKRIGES